jgi:hypothetical protein
MEHNITYHINEEKRTVVAVLHTNPLEVALEISNIAEKSFNNNLRFVIPYDTNLYIKDTYKGKAVCHKDDEWDVEKGKRIAKFKALHSFMKDHKKITAVAVDIFEDALKRVKAADHYSDYSLRHIAENLEKE